MPALLLPCHRPWVNDVFSLHHSLLTIAMQMIIDPSSENIHSVKPSHMGEDRMAHSRHLISAGHDHYLIWTWASLLLDPFFSLI